MPKQVNHTERRRQLAEALWRLAAQEGLEAVSLSRVADEAGVSKGRVQHYFSSREEMLDFTVSYLHERVDARLRARLEQTQPATPLDTVRVLAEGLLPIDEDGRTVALVSSAFFVRALARPDMSGNYRDGQAKIVRLFTDQLSAAQRTGELSARVDPEREADILLAVIGGIGDALLLDRHTPHSARQVLDYHLARIAGPPTL